MFIASRSAHNPLLSPVLEHPWEAVAAFNGCPVKVGKDTIMLYRAIGKHDMMKSEHSISTIGKAKQLKNGTFGDQEQFIFPEQPWEKDGCEDPRVTHFEGKYYTFYTAISELPAHAGSIKVACAVSSDLKKITSKHLVTPFNAKAMTLFPERVNGKVTAVLTAHTDEPPAHIVLVQADKIEDFWDENFWKNWHEHINDHIINVGKSGNDHFEVGAQPIKTDKGWLLVYSYIQNYFGGGTRVFGIEALLLDANNPKEIIGRTANPILVPEAPYELYGTVPNIIFPSGALLDGDKLDIYYGGADTVCAKATVSVTDLLNAMTPEGRESLVTRSNKNPILTTDKDLPWKSQCVFNAAALDLEGKIHLLYRAMGADNTSVMGYANTTDGETIDEQLNEPAYWPRTEYEMKKKGPTDNSGCEDPRLIKMGSTIYLIYTAYDSVSATRVALSTISEKDFIHKKFKNWSEPIIISPEGTNDKDVCLFPKKIDGKYLIFHRIANQICAEFVDDLEQAGKRGSSCIDIMGPRAGYWDSEKIGIAGPPVETPNGWLLIYHGISRDKSYSLGAVLLDKKDPTIVKSRLADAILEPKQKYEKEGVIPNVVFSCGQVVRDDTVFLYYGGADKVIGVATFSLSKLLKLLEPEI